MDPTICPLSSYEENRRWREIPEEIKEEVKEEMDNLSSMIRKRLDQERDSDIEDQNQRCAEGSPNQ